MVLSLDSLGQCVSALSKRFAAAESIRDSTVNGLPHSHREKHSEVRHRKDTHHHHQEDSTPKTKVEPASACSLPASSCLFLLWAHCGCYLMQVINGKVPTSILKRPSPSYGSEPEPNHRRKGERRVRFREPETTVHGERNRMSLQAVCSAIGPLSSR